MSRFRVNVVCTDQGLTSLPDNLPPDTIFLNVANNQVKTLWKTCLGVKKNYIFLGIHEIRHVFKRQIKVSFRTFLIVALTIFLTMILFTYFFRKLFLDLNYVYLMKSKCISDVFVDLFTDGTF